MKVLLLTPTRKQPMPSEAPRILRERTVMPPLGLLRLHAALKAAGHDPVIFDAGARDAGDTQIIAQINRCEAQIVSIGTTTAQIVDTWRMCRSIKKAAPDLITLVGGPHVNWYAKETARLTGVDYVLQGESDESLAAFVQTLEEGGDVSAIPGLTALRGGEIIQGPEALPVADLDALPPMDRRALGATAYRDPAMPGRLASAEMTRGCPYDCAFCSTPRGTVRHRESDSVVGELMGIQKDDLADSLYFVDDTWNLNPKKALAVSVKLAEQNFRLPWIARLRINTMTRDLLRAMKKAGCVRVQLGVEAGSQEAMDAVNKRLTLKQVREAFVLTRETGVESVGYFMLGLPTDRTVEDLRSTVRFSVGLAPDYALYNVFTPYPFTALFDDGVEKGIVDAAAWTRFAQNPDPAFSPRPWTRHLSAQILYKELARAYRSFYFRPGRIVRQLLKPGTWGRAFKAGIGMLRT